MMAACWRHKFLAAGGTTAMSSSVERLMSLLTPLDHDVEVVIRLRVSRDGDVLVAADGRCGHHLEAWRQSSTA
jgi:hypothetical protein